MSPVDKNAGRSSPTILAASWSDGVVALQGERREHELAGLRVRGLAPDGQGGALALVHDGGDGHALRRRAPDGVWSTLATDARDLACCLAVGDALYVGTDGDARLLRARRLDEADSDVRPARTGQRELADQTGTLERVKAFDATPGRSRWFAGTAVVDGRVVGPPLGVRSLTATAAAANHGPVLLASVHVGGIARSTDGGNLWDPTIDINHDVHQVCAHPTRPEWVAAAAAVGLCVSRDAGATWSVKSNGLHACYGSAVTWLGDDILLAASTDHFASEGAVYRCMMDGTAPARLAGEGLPPWLGGIADTGCLVARGEHAALVDKAGTLYASGDGGRSWRVFAEGLSGTSSLLIV